MLRTGQLLGPASTPASRPDPGAPLPATSSSDEQTVLVAGVDLSEVRRAERALVQAQRLEAMGVVAGRVAHNGGGRLGVLHRDLPSNRTACPATSIHDPRDDWRGKLFHLPSPSCGDQSSAVASRHLGRQPADRRQHRSAGAARPCDAAGRQSPVAVRPVGRGNADKQRPERTLTSLSLSH